MKRWGVAVAGLYGLAATVLAWPVTIAAFWPEVSGSDALRMYLSVAFWIWIAVIVCGALLLLLIPAHFAERRLRPRRALLIPIITTGCMLAVLGLLLILSIVLAVWGDSGPPLPDSIALTVFCLAAVLLWTGWGVLFYRATRTDGPKRLAGRAATWLLRGSILEVLVAVSCHVVVRRREDCCAPLGTFLGIAAGLSVMLLSFGPGVLFLFAERHRRLRHAAPADRKSSVTA